MTHLRTQKGFTLVEVIMVIVIMAVLAAVAMKSLDSGLEATRIEETKTEMAHLANAISGNPDLFTNGVRSDFGFVGDVGAMPATLDQLVTNPGYGTWNGPYVNSDFTNFADDYKRDAWGQLYVFSGGTAIRATGAVPDTLTRILTSATTDLTANSVIGQITDAAGNPPGDSSVNITVTLSYPDGAGGIEDSSVTPNSSGNFAFADCVPIGNHSIMAVYSSTGDTIVSSVSVLPKSTVQSTLRFPGALFAATGGGGGSPTDLLYVAGSADVSGTGNRDVRFTIENPSATSKYISTVKLTYSLTAYYTQVRWGSTTVFNSSTPRAASGQVVTFTTGQTIGGYGGTVIIQVINFRSTPSGGGANVDMSNTLLTVEFSDGSVMTFNSGT